MTHRAFAQASPVPTSPRSPAGHELGTHEPAAETRHWLRTCNGVGETLMSDYTTASFCAQQPGVTGDLTTGLRWIADNMQFPGMPAHVFELRPLTAEQAEEWREVNEPATAR